LKPGQVAKVIAKGRCLVGKIRYVGPVASLDSDDTYVGLQLLDALGDSDGTFGGKKFFDW
jgi:dynactin complex subunit